MKKLTKKQIAIIASVLAAVIVVTTVSLVLVKKNKKENENTTSEITTEANAKEWTEQTAETLTEVVTETEEKQPQTTVGSNSESNNSANDSKSNSSSYSNKVSGNNDKKSTTKANNGVNSNSSSNKTYHTSWGLRPHEFEEVYREEYFGLGSGINVYCHYDRYGNKWYDNSNSKTSGHGKSVYNEYLFDDVRYYGEGRWSNMNHYWSEYTNESGSCGNWGTSGFYAPSNWEKGKSVINSAPSEDKIVNYFNIITDFMRFQDNESAQKLKNNYGLSHSQLNGILNHNVPIPNLGKVAP